MPLNLNDLAENTTMADLVRASRALVQEAKSLGFAHARVTFYYSDDHDEGAPWAQLSLEIGAVQYALNRELQKQIVSVHFDQGEFPSHRVGAYRSIAGAAEALSDWLRLQESPANLKVKLASNALIEAAKAMHAAGYSYEAASALLGSHFPEDEPEEDALERMALPGPDPEAPGARF